MKIAMLSEGIFNIPISNRGGRTGNNGDAVFFSSPSSGGGVDP